MPWILVALSLLSALGLACSSDAPRPEKTILAESESGPSPPPATPAQTPPERERCLERIGALMAREGIPGAVEFDAQRSRILSRAKGTPLLFLRAPKVTDDPRAEPLRARIERAPTPGYAVYDLYPRLAREPALARAVLLREGYLYAETPGLAAALAYVVRLQHLFTEERIYVQRGGDILRAERRKGPDGPYYEYADGPEEGRTAQILFLDRAAADVAELADPLHRDLVPLAAELGFDRAFVAQLLPEAMVLELRYGAIWVPTLVQTSGARVTFDCEALPADRVGQERVLHARSRAVRLERVLARQRAVIGEQIDEALPFDEPKTEVGQQDGKLRQAWVWAHRYGRTTFEFNEDKYYVFDHRGRPRVPQVCIDFIRDTYERAAGTWFSRRGEPRERIRGKLAFGELSIENERSVDSFVLFAAEHPQWFDVWNLDEGERIPLIKRDEFYAYLYERRDDFRPGDVVTIYGLRDDGKMHYHSFFVYQADPVTGMPTLVAANAGRPRIAAWDMEMANAPFRSIKTRIRPRLEWLESVTLQEAPVETVAARAASPI